MGAVPAETVTPLKEYVLKFGQPIKKGVRKRGRFPYNCDSAAG